MCCFEVSLCCLIGCWTYILNPLARDLIRWCNGMGLAAFFVVIGVVIIIIVKRAGWDVRGIARLDAQLPICAVHAPLCLCELVLPPDTLEKDILTYSLAMRAGGLAKVLNGQPLLARALALDLPAYLCRMDTAGNLGAGRMGARAGEFVQLPTRELGTRLPFAANEATNSVKTVSQTVSQRID